MLRKTKTKDDGVGKAMLGAMDSILQNITDQLLDYHKVGIANSAKAKVLVRELIEELAQLEWEHQTHLMWSTAHQYDRRRCRKHARAVMKTIQDFWNKKMATANRPKQRGKRCR